jgi:hypothetical protein
MDVYSDVTEEERDQKKNNMEIKQWKYEMESDITGQWLTESVKSNSKL